MAVLGLVSAFGQGAVMFANKIVGVVDAPVFAEDGQTRLDGNTYLTQLYVAVRDAPLQAVDTPVGFRSGNSAGYIVPRVVTLPGIPGGTRVRLEMRAWEAARGGSYEAALANGGLIGASPTFEVVCGAAPSPPADLVGLRSFSLQRVEPVRLSSGPQSRTLAVGSALAWLVEATGAGPITYQWSKDGVPLPGAVAPTFEIPAVRLEDSGVYRVRASNPWSTVDSPEARLLVLIPPTVQRQPQPQTIVAGGSAVLSIEAAGSPPLSYQWRRDGRDLEGANQPSLSLAGFTAGDAGSYSVRVTNPVGSVESVAVPVAIAYTFDGVAGSGGTVDWEPRAPAYPPGTVVRIVATPDSGFAFRGWMGATQGSDNPLSVTLAANVEVAAVFGPVNGTVSFLNRVLVSGVDAPVFDVDGVTRLEGTAYLAQLYGGATADDLQPVGPIVWFGTGTGAGYFASDRYPTRAVPPVPLGGRAVVEVRAWAAADGASYEAAWSSGGRAGRSGVIELVTGGAGEPPTFPADLVGLRSFALERPRPPQLSQQPADTTVVAGQSAELEVVATGAEPLLYQWYAGESGDTSGAISEANAARFRTPGLEVTTRYWVRVHNHVGAVDSETATVTVLAVPRITSQPQPLAVAPGRSATLTIVASGAEPLGYQWYLGPRDGVSQPIVGATAASYTTPPLTATTTYWVRVSNAAGFADSEAATVIVLEPPAITLGPDDVSVVSGQSATLAVVATGAQPLSYQWYQGTSGDVRQPVLGATSPAFETPPLTLPSRYWVRVTNAAGTADSRAVTVTVLGPPVITQQPTDTSVVSGQSASLAVTATGTEPLTYQWYQELSGAPPQPIPGANASSHTTSALEATSHYWVRIVNAAGSTESQKATVSVVEPLRITRQPVGAALPLGSAFTLSVTAAGVEPLRYHWRRNDQDIPDATNTTYQIPWFGLEAAGTYSAEVSNEYGALESDHVSLTPSGLALLELRDQFEDRRTFLNDSYQGLTNNLDATFQDPAGEPRHAGKSGGKSLWFTWRPGLSGVATFSTVGSGFDTLLAVYQGNALSSLVEVASDEDRGGYLTSRLSFNAIGGADYHIAVDGFAGAAGELILSWGLVPAAPALPEITESPSSRVVPEGEPVTLTVVSPTPGATYTWFFEGQMLPGEAQANLSFTASPARVGTYRARVTASSGAFLDSADARVEVVPAGVAVTPEEPTSVEKWQDLFADEALPGPVRLQGRPVRMGFTPISPGLGARYTDLRGRGPSLAGPPTCQGGMAGTRWMRFRTDRLLPVTLSLESTEVSAVMATYHAPPVEPAVMPCVIARVNEGPAVGSFLARPGVDYLVMVAGASGGSGKVLLTWEAAPAEVVLGEPESGVLPDGRLRVVWPLLPPGDYELRLTDDLSSWHREFETNVTSGVIEYTAPEPILAPARFYYLRQVLR